MKMFPFHTAFPSLCQTHICSFLSFVNVYLLFSSHCISSQRWLHFAVDKRDSFINSKVNYFILFLHFHQD